MEVTKEHILLYEFNKGNNATESVRNIKGVYGDRTISVSQCQRWFLKFRAGNYSLEDEASSWKICRARQELQTLVENPIVTIEKLVEKLGFGHSTIHRPACHRKNQQIV